MSRIFYNGRFFHYPIRLVNALLNLGPWESVLIVGSYLAAQLRPARGEASFESWVANRFGTRLYRTFFQTYTEKVWGRPCSEIHSDWAAQRIQNLSLIRAVWNAIFGGQLSKSLIEHFSYPRLGPGMMWERFAEAIEAGGGELRLNTAVEQLRLEDGRVVAVEARSGEQLVTLPARHVISSAPLVQLVRLFDPPLSSSVHEAADHLTHRAFLVVSLIIERPDLFPDQWIYVHSPEVEVGRIQNFGSWSPDMVPEPGRSCVGMEYFCDQGDEIWERGDADLIAQARREIATLGLAREEQVLDGVVVRQPDAYPVYHPEYADQIDVIRAAIEQIDNLQTIGRSGLHRYNNMDHSMKTGALAAANALGEHHDIWAVNDEQDYLEGPAPVREQALIRTFARMDKFAFATAFGTTMGLLTSMATLWLVLKGGDHVGHTLRLLANYFIGYNVTPRGALIGFGYSFVWGFLFGWLFAYLRNLMLAFYAYRARREAELLTFKDFIDQF